MFSSFRNSYFIGEILVRGVLFYILFATEHVEPFRRKIQPEELWLYKNPRVNSYVPTFILGGVAILTPALVFTLATALQKEKSDVIQASLGLTLVLGLNGVLTNFLKLTVGRPRPDFLWRCFPDGRFTTDMQCTGITSEIIDGLKSFPSGHSSFAFASLGFTAFYIAGRLQCFNASGRGQSWRVCVTGLPLVGALAIAISRTCDYHHHWQDVWVGSILGLALAYLCYRQYFPSLSSNGCNRSYVALANSDVNLSHKSDLVTVKSI